MYWRQWIAAILGGIAAGYYFTTIGYTLSQGLYIAGIGIVLIRWTLATIGRSRYWLNRGTRGVHTEQCPNCQRNRHRVSGDWILTCKQCGWQPGYPGLRWITNSVPSIQFHRSGSLSGLIVILVLLIAFLSGWAVPYGALQDVGSSSVPVAGTITSGQSAVDTTSIEETQAKQGDLNTTEVEHLVWKYTNERRENHDLRPVTYDSELATVVRDHSENMAKHDYVGHTEPNGETGEERYGAICDFTGTGYAFGENAFGAWYNRRMISYHSNETVYLTTEEEVARYLVNGWMNSTGHRKNILNDGWGEVGVGIHVRDDGKVFATQAFC